MTAVEKRLPSLEGHFALFGSRPHLDKRILRPGRVDLSPGLRFCHCRWASLRFVKVPPGDDLLSQWSSDGMTPYPARGPGHPMHRALSLTTPPLMVSLLSRDDPIGQ